MDFQQLNTRGKIKLKHKIIKKSQNGLKTITLKYSPICQTGIIKEQTVLQQKKIQQNPFQLEKYEAADIKQQKQQHLKQQMSQQCRKGGKMFRFRDASDFNSYFPEAQRIQRQKNRKLFQKKYGGDDMAYRSIASQSDYNPNLRNEFRSRNKQKQINPPMRYTKVELLISMQKKRAKSMFQKNNNPLNKKQEGKHQDYQNQQIMRKNTSHTNSHVGTEDEFRSINSMKDQQDSSQQSQRNLKKFAVTLQNPYKGKKKQSSKSYFVGITDIKQNSKDPHIKKTLHNILVKIGKTHPNPRDRSLASNIQVLSTDIN